jgi:DNA polymerase-3 subunit epsilon/exodeoxyribonuclease X
MLIFLDVQTTGLEQKDMVCAIGLIIVDGDTTEIKYDLVNSNKKISPKASSIHHITNEMIKDKPNLKDSESYKFLEHNNKEDVTIISHHIGFGLQKLFDYGFKWHGKIIDTLRVTKHLIPECEFFSLQFLRMN